MRRMLIRFDKWFQINRLQQFNAKFFPRWVPRYMMVDGWLAAPRAGIAIMDLEGQLPQLRPGHTSTPSDATASTPAAGSA